ncbi:MAG TPA: TonB-dependent receptor [Steroidobacteraceae bacterium]|nr:TonB-dependent receptor [Steroidobacteraceae bacterium]
MPEAGDEKFNINALSRAGSWAPIQENLVRRSSFRVTVASLPLFMYAAVANAELEDSPDTVVVTATRIPTPEIEIASSISVVTAEEIAARQLQTLPDLLKQMPGLNAVQSGGPGGLTSVFMRGTNSNHTKVLVDGIDVSDPSSPGGNFDFGPFLLQDVQKVEILRGPQSGLYGSDAIGGVINIITKEGSGPAQVTIRAEAGSFDTFNQSAGVSGSIDRFRYAATIEHLHSGATPVTPLDLLAPGERRIDDYDDNLTASTKLSFAVTDQFDLGLVARYTDSHLRLTGENYANFPADFPDSAQSANDTRQYYTRATGHLISFGGALEQSLGLAYSSIKSFETSPDNPESDFFGARVKVDWQGNVRVAADEKLVLGAEHQRDEMTVPISASTTIDSGYAELQSSFGNTIFNTLSVRYDDNDRFGGKVTYRVAPAYVIQDTGTKLKASVGTGFKAPTLSQMFQNFPDFFFFGNPNLKPESSLGFDAGFEQAVAGDAVRFGATYYRNNIKNLIVDNADFTSLANIGRAVTDGVESFVAYRATEALSLRLDYTFTQATDDIAHEELLRRPKHKASLNASWQATKRLSLDATVVSVSSWVDGNRDFSIERLTAPGHTTVDFAASYDLTGNLTFYGRVNNLFDRHYEDPVGFLQPTLGAFAGIRTRF